MAACPHCCPVTNRDRSTRPSIRTAGCDPAIPRSSLPSTRSASTASGPRPAGWTASGRPRASPSSPRSTENCRSSHSRSIPIPRLLSAEDWAGIGAGLRQRTRALNAFLADVYGEASIVRDGVIPEAVIQNCPGFLPAARDLAPGGRPRAAVLGFDLLHAPSGRWVVLEDNLRVPSGLGICRLQSADRGGRVADVASLARSAIAGIGRRGTAVRVGAGDSAALRSINPTGRGALRRRRQLGLVRAPTAGRRDGRPGDRAG